MVTESKYTLWDIDCQDPTSGPLPSVECGGMVIEQNHLCQWNELAFEINGEQVIVPLARLHEVAYFLYNALHGMNQMKAGNPKPKTWRGINRG